MIYNFCEVKKMKSTKKNFSSLFHIQNSTSKEIIDAIKQLQEDKCISPSFPQELKSDMAIINAERVLGIRKFVNKGYDILKLHFFVNESVLISKYGGEIKDVPEASYFPTFAEFFNYLSGDIYKNACYYGYTFSQEEIHNFNIDINKINQDSLINYTIDDFTLSPSNEEIKKYQEGEKTKKRLIDWSKKFDACTTYEQFIKTFNRTNQSSFARKYQTFFIFNYINKFHDIAFDIIMRYINENLSDQLEECLCLFYDKNTVLDAYDNIYYSKSAASSYKKDLQNFILSLTQNPEQLSVSIYFDESTHFYTHKTSTKFKYSEIKFYRYFESFEALASFLNNDLSNADLAKVITKKFDTSLYKSDQHTKWPISCYDKLNYTVYKGYSSQKFIVIQEWTDANNNVLKKQIHRFNYCFDFIHFLKRDLSSANLISCDGLENLPNFNGINIYNAKIKSNVLLKLGVDFERISLPATKDNPIALDNEIMSVARLNSNRISYNFEEELKHQKIYYISDLHLLHRLHNAHCLNDSDVEYLIQCVVIKIMRVSSFINSPIILIGGDVSSDFTIYEKFIGMLRKSIASRTVKPDIVFVLGNHELWPFPNESLNNIVEKYKLLIESNGMHLLHNSIFYKSDNGIAELSEIQLNSLSCDEILDKLTTARTIIFGGLAFAGKNNEFNANVNIYRSTIDRAKEIEESKKFEALYEKVCSYLPNRKVIIFTHMPKADWSSNDILEKGYIYVSGHSHRNYFYDDGDYRIYADNQIGYHTESFALKYFYLDNEYDLFERYADGIYEISKSEYSDFYRGKNICLTFNRDNCKIYMLKKIGYYMFILQYPNGNLCILNGGAVKKLPINHLEYYYNNMDKVISTIKTPLDKFTAYQTEISSAIKSFGGFGTIHGAIVDIDFYNHIYVNPIDLKITPYWASDIINKIAYPSISSLLKIRCPNLFLEYQQKANNSSQLQLISNSISTTDKITPYTDTDIYRASREINKMQKLSSNILSIWIDTATNKLTF